MENRHTTDVLVIGGGIAGCFAAIKAREQNVNVLLVDKGYVGSSGQTPFANSFTVFNAEWGDNLKHWMDQVNTGGDYLNNQNWTKLVLLDTYQRYQDLISYGIPFLMDKDEKPFRTGNADMGPCVCAFPDRQILASALRKKVLDVGVKIIDRIMVTDLVKTGENISGAVGMTVADGEFCVFQVKTVVICTGASGFKPTGWPIANLTSDGDMMAYRAGAAITGKEFIDTHCTSMAHSAFVGPIFLNMPQGGAPPPNIFHDAEGNAHQGTSIFHLGPEYFVHGGMGPVTTQLPHGTEKIVGGASSGMASHKTEGIWAVGYDGGVGIPGLYAAGDSLGTMLSGAAYSATGLALAGSASTGALSGTSAATYSKTMGKHLEMNQTAVVALRDTLYLSTQRKGGFSPRWVITLLQNTMIPYYTMIIKEKKRLEAALEMIKFYQSHFVPNLTTNDAHELRLAIELKNMLLNAEMKLRASLYREESRGTHYREDFPNRDEEQWNQWITIKENAGEMTMSKHSMPASWQRQEQQEFLFQFPRFEGGKMNGNQ